MPNSLLLFCWLPKFGHQLQAVTACNHHRQFIGEQDPLSYSIRSNCALYAVRWPANKGLTEHTLARCTRWLIHSMPSLCMSGPVSKPQVHTVAIQHRRAICTSLPASFGFSSFKLTACCACVPLYEPLALQFVWLRLTSVDWCSMKAHSVRPSSAWCEVGALKLASSYYELHKGDFSVGL